MRDKFLFFVILTLCSSMTIGCKVVRAQGPPTAGYVVYQNYTPTGVCNLPNYLTVTTVTTGAGVYQCKGDPTPTWQQVGPATGGITQLQGDVIAGPGTGIQQAVLTALGAAVNNCGDATHVCQISYDTKGRVIASSAISISGGGGGGIVTVGNLAPLFTSTVTGTALTFTLSTAAQNVVFAGPATGGTGTPSYRALVAADIPSLSYAPLASPTFTGTPLAPTATLGTNTTQLATTAFVQARVITFDQLGSGTNLGHGLVCGAGCVISGTNGGFINANELNGVLLSGLATGLLKNTTSTGAASIASAGTDYLLPNGSSAALSQATTSAFGVVKPDGTTITISGGVISAVGGGGGISVVGTPTAGQDMLWASASSAKVGHCTDNGTTNNCTIPQQVTSTAGPSAYYFTVNGQAAATLANSAAIGISSTLTTPSFVSLFDAPCTGFWFVTNTSGIMPSTCVATVPVSAGGTGVTTAAFSTLTDGSTVTWAVGSTALVANSTLTFTTHGGSRTLNLTGMVAGGSYVMKLIQDATGGEGLTLGTGCTWKVIGGGTGAIAPSTGASALDVLAWTYDGTNCVANFGKNYN